MSYEGYEQCICKSGHYFENHDIYGMDGEANCPHCKEPAAWVNSVDDTNCESSGIIPEELLRKRFLLTAEIVGKCDMGHMHTVKEAVFRIPTQDETGPLQHHWDGDKFIPYYPKAVL